MKKINQKKMIDLLFKIVVTLFAFFGLITLVVMFSFILKEAIPAYKKYNISNLYFSVDYSKGTYGMLGALVLTLISSIFSIIIALPIAIKCSFFLHFRLKKSKKIFTTIIHVLASIPSILFGIFAFYSLSKFTNYVFKTNSGQSLINGIMMLTIMIMPTLITMILNQLKILPKNFIHSSLALGNSKTYAIHTLVKKEIRSGIIVATITALGRAIGETMALSLLLTSIPNETIFQEGFLKIFSNNTMTLGVVIAKTFFDDVGGSKSHLFAAGILLFVFIMFLVLLVSRISNNRKFYFKNPLLRIKKIFKNKSFLEIRIKYFILLWYILILPISILNYLFYLTWISFSKYLKYFFYYLFFPINKLLYPSHKNQINSNYFVKVIKSRGHKSMDLYRITLEFISIFMVGIFSFWIIIDILYNGLPTWTINDWKYSYISKESNVSQPGSIANPLVFTIALVGIVIAISFPIALFSAIYLSEYARNKRHSKIIKFFLDSLGGTPSILFGIFGSIFFIHTLNFRMGKIPFSLLAGSLTMVLVVIPTFTRSIEQTILKIPNSYREASFALGTSKTKTIFKIIIPQSISGITTGVILTTGRVIAETAPIYLTLGAVLTSGEISLFSPGHTLTTEILGTFWTNPDFNIQRTIGYKLGAAAIILSISISLLSEFIEPLLKWRPISKIINLFNYKKVVKYVK